MKKNYKSIIGALIIIMLFTLCACDKNRATVINQKQSEITDNKLSKLFLEYTPELDGAYAEGYEAKLYDAYKKSNAQQFVKVLSNNELYLIEGIIKLFVSSVFWDGEEQIVQFEKDFEEIKKQKDITRKEKYVAYEMLARLIYCKEALDYKE